MNNRILFMIINNQVRYLESPTGDHREWYLSLGLDPNNFDNVIRGFIMDNKIVFYKGSTFNYDQEVINAALIYSPSIRTYLNNPILKVYCGIMINGYNSKWEPVLEIKDEEINNYVPPVVKEEKKDYSKVETGPVIEFKNDYNDPKFIKRAVIVTGIVLVLTLIVKIFLFQKQSVLQTRNFLDILLAVGQIALLGVTIYGYISKKSFTKYIGLIASVLIILTLDVFDIIIGILYFIFSIDQNYYIKLFNILKNIGKGKNNV